MWTFSRLIVSPIVISLWLLTCQTSSAEIISSPRTTYWGDWGSWDDCPKGSLVNKMQLKVEDPLGSGDDTALNGIRFFCTSESGSGGRVETITSTVGDWGSWGSTVSCPDGQYAVGFEFRSEGTVGSEDDTAANNLRLICEDGTGLIGPNGRNWGFWSQPQKCSVGSYICGIRTQVEAPQGGGGQDDTALNNMDARCCPKVHKYVDLTRPIRLESSIYKIEFQGNEIKERLKSARERKVLMQATSTIINNGTGSLSKVISVAKTIRERYEVEELKSLSSMHSVNVELNFEVTATAGVPFLGSAEMKAGLRSGYTYERTTGGHNRRATVTERERTITFTDTVNVRACSAYDVEVYVNVIEDFEVTYDLWLKVEGSARTERKDANGQFIWEPATDEQVKQKLDRGLKFIRNVGDGRSVIATTRGKMRVEVGGNSILNAHERKPFKCSSS